ncbi:MULTISPECIES: hypothetical protein [Enterobacter]|nr:MULTISPECIES: hypothetical protein [Enterobacter]
MAIRSPESHARIAARTAALRQSVRHEARNISQKPPAAAPRC